MIRLPQPPLAYSIQWATNMQALIEREFRNLDAANNSVSLAQLTVGNLIVTGGVSLPAGSIDVTDINAGGTNNSANFLRGDSQWSNTLIGPFTAAGDILSNSDIRTRGILATGGGDMYCRHLYAGGSPGGFHLQDNLAVVEYFKIAPDAQPATKVTFSIGAASPNLPALSLDVATGNATFTAVAGCVMDLQKTAGGPGSNAIRSLNSAGAVATSITMSTAGLTSITNDLALANALTVANGGHARAAGFGQPSEFNNGTVGAADTIDWGADGASQRLTLTTATACTLTFTAPPNIGWYTLKTISPAAGTVPAINWPASVKWAAATKPVQAATLGRANVQRFYWDGTNYWGDAIVNAA